MTKLTKRVSKGVIFYILHLRNLKVIKVNADESLNLLVPYPGIKGFFINTLRYKRQDVINHYFLEYLKELHSDSTYRFTPYIEPEFKKIDQLHSSQKLRSWSGLRNCIIIYG